MKTAESILPLVYEELRRLAKVRMTKEKPGQTLSATALVHEAYLLLTKKGDEPVWENKRHFFAAAATSMRRILRERALRKSRFRHGGNVRRVMFDNSSISINLEDEKWAGEFLDLDSALEDLKKERPAAASLVELRFFFGIVRPRGSRSYECI